jgi:3-dehydroquinate synthase
VSAGRTVRVGRGSHRYAVRIGPAALAELPDVLAQLGLDGHRAAIVTDRTVERLHGSRLRAVLGGAAEVSLFSVPPGEREKTRRRWEEITDGLLAAGFGRDTVVMAFGGGVVGDLAGFVAATYLRGVPVVQLPTTLLAMVDASVGGKTGVDTPAGKNLVGAFHPPRAVLADLELLRTLPARELRGGLAEAVKHGALADAPYLRRIGRAADALLRAETRPVSWLVARSVRIKARVVGRDPLERSERALLNFGHTLAHALEAESGFTMAHGEAVSVGMVAAARIGEALGVTRPGVAGEIAAALARLALPTRFPEGSDAAALLARAALDKKGREGRPRFVLLRDLGEPHVVGGDFTHEVEPAVVRAVVEGMTG